MIELKELLKKLNLTKKNKALIVLAVICFLMLLISEIFSLNVEEEKTEFDTAYTSYEYVKKQEERLEKLIKKIDGAGETEVMITLESCYENVYLKDSFYKSEVKEKDVSEESEEKYVLKDDENGIVIKVYEPTVKGVAVVCEGGGNPETASAILETVMAVFNINSTNISVTERIKSE